MSDNKITFKRSLTLMDATMVVVGSMIGSGIFIVGSEMMGLVGSSWWYTLAWVLTGILTMIGALSYTELSAMFPELGGQYAYLQKAYNDLISFLFGWSTLLVIQTGTIAAVAMGFAKFLAYLIPAWGEDKIAMYIGGFSISIATLIAIASILLLTYINSLGIVTGKWVQNLFTITKIGCLLLVLCLGLSIAFDFNIWRMQWHNAFAFKTFDYTTSTWRIPNISEFIGLVVSSFVGAFFSSIAWENVTFISSEVINPKKNIARSLFLGTLIVTFLYVSLNLMYLGTLSQNEMVLAPHGRIGIAVAGKIFGTIATTIIAIMVVISTLGCNNGLILASSRVYYAMAKDNLFFSSLAKLNKRAVPGNALWIQGIWASILCFSGSYSAILSYTISIVLIAYILSILGIFILRKKMPQHHRPYLAIGYPILPLFYIVITSIICIGLFIYQPQNLIGLVIVLLGIPVYVFFKKQQRQNF